MNLKFIFYVDEGISSAQSNCFSSIISDDGSTLAIQYLFFLE